MVVGMDIEFRRLSRILATTNNIYCETTPDTDVLVTHIHTHTRTHS
jgi:hypothetical protein